MSVPAGWSPEMAWEYRRRFRDTDPPYPSEALIRVMNAKDGSTHMVSLEKWKRV